MTNESTSYIVKSDTEPQNIHNRLMVPLRLVGENMNYQVRWDQENQTAYLDRRTGNLNPAVESGKQYEIVGEIFDMDSFSIHADLFFAMNNAREEHHRAPLGLHAELSKIALDKRYRSDVAGGDPHRDTKYGYPAEMLDRLGFDSNYTYSSEIICLCDDAVDGWLGSKKGHREALLSNQHTHVGVAYTFGWQIGIFVK